jgi:hypothetical protein
MGLFSGSGFSCFKPTRTSVLITLSLLKMHIKNIKQGTLVGNAVKIASEQLKLPANLFIFSPAVHCSLSAYSCLRR